MKRVSICGLMILGAGIITIGIGIAFAIPPAIVGGVFLIGAGGCLYIFAQVP